MTSEIQRAQVRPASSRFGFAQIDGRVVRSQGGYLLWFTAGESELIERLITATDGSLALPVTEWFDPAEPEFQQRVADLPGLLARGVVRTHTRDGETWLSLTMPMPPAEAAVAIDLTGPDSPTPGSIHGSAPQVPDPDHSPDVGQESVVLLPHPVVGTPRPGHGTGGASAGSASAGRTPAGRVTALREAPTVASCPACATAAERAEQADVIGAVMRARGGRWLLRSDAAVLPCDHPADSGSASTGAVAAGTASTGIASSRTASADPAAASRAIAARTAAAGTGESPPGFHAYSTSWRGGSAETTRARLLGLVDVDTGIIAGIRRGTGLPESIPVWFAGPNRAFSTADPSGLTWRWPGSAMGKGITDAEAQLSALAEAAERWSGTWQRGDGTSPLAGTDLATGETVPVASDLVFMGHPPVVGHVRHTDSNGLAAGVTLADAQLQALLEIVERDAISAWWEGESIGSRVPLDGLGELGSVATLPDGVMGEELRPFLGWLAKLGLRVDLQHLPSLDGTVTLLAVGWLPVSGRWLYGAGTHLDAGIAVRRAVLELVQSTVASLATPTQVAPGRGIRAELHPDPPGSVGDADHEDVAGLPWALAPSTDTTGAPAGDLTDTVRQLAVRLAAQGRRTVAVDVTRPEVGVPVARVVVQHARGMPLPMR